MGGGGPFKHTPHSSLFKYSILWVWHGWKLVQGSTLLFHPFVKGEKVFRREERKLQTSLIYFCPRQALFSRVVLLLFPQLHKITAKVGTVLPRININWTKSSYYLWLKFQLFFSKQETSSFLTSSSTSFFRYYTKSLLK